MTQPPHSVMQAARVLSGQTQAQLAAAVGVAQSAISQYETGDGITDPDIAAAAASVLDIPPALLGMRPPAPQILHHLPPSLPQRPANRALASVTMTHARVSLLLGPPTVILRRSPGGTGSSHPHGYAESLRKEWQIPPGPVSGLVPALESHGIVCVYRDLSALRTRALASTSADGGVLMFLDSGASRHELVWSVAHELGHLVFGDEPSKTGESHADEFAIEFLAPSRELLNVTVTTSEELAATAMKFGVPARALVKRLRQLRRVSARGERELVGELPQFPPVELPASFIGSPSKLAAAVRKLGGSAAAAPHAFMTVEQLRTDYLARSAG